MVISKYSILDFIYNVKSKLGALWVKEDSLKFSASLNLQNEETKDFILNNKEGIISILKENEIFSREDFVSKLILKVSDLNEYRLSSFQERIWFIEQYAEGSNAYHIPRVFELSSGTDVSGIKYALDQVVSRHEILRSRIIDSSSGNGIQIVDDNRLSIEEFSLASDSDYESLIRKEIHRPFDLAKDPPIRVHLYYIDSSQDSSSLTLLFINVHHIASDGWSTNIFKQELNAYYNAYLRGDKNFSLPALEIQYKDYAQWQRSYLSDSILSSQLDYWKSKLSGFEPLELLSDYPRPSRIDYRGANIPFHLSADLSKHLRSLARDYGVTLQNILLSGLNVLLYKYTGQDDIIIGSPVASRYRRQTKDLIGLFMNVQVNRSVLRVGQSYESLIKEVHQDQVAAQQHQDLPFERLIEELEVSRDNSRHPVFQILYNFHSFNEPSENELGYSSYFQSYSLDGVDEGAKLDLSFFITTSKENIAGTINYGTSLFKASTIEVLRGYYIDLLEDMVASPGSSYSDFKLLRGSAYQEVVYDWNSTDAAYDVDASLVSLFEAQVAESPDAVALVYEGEMLTYGELNAKSNQLARHLHKLHQDKYGIVIPSEACIGLYLERGFDMVISMLGVLKAGGAYVPIDPDYPADRVRYILEDSGSKFVLTQTMLMLDNLSDVELPSDLIAVDLIETEDSGNLGLPISSDSLAYVIYTSGTTGKPKGVMVEHGNVTNLITDLQVQYEIEPSERFILFASYVFDASVEQLFLSLLSGSSLYLVDRAVIGDAKKFTEFVASNGITHVHATPSYLVEVSPDQLPTLKRVIFGGEYLSKRLFESYSAHIPIVINEYGPTETTITSLVSINSYLLNNISISNTKVYVLDNSGHPVPVGVAGELYIGGAGVSRGYLNREALTSERFVLNRFASKSDRSKGYDRLYKTGDLVRWHSDGNLEYLGRNDDQVKIRGYRIELGEIESALSSIGGVSQSCVLSKERTTDSGESKYLVGYYVLEEGSEELTEEYLLEALSSLVPDYMIPSRLIVLEQFPLTVNGKLDRRSLPEVESLSGEDEYVAPQSETERSLCKIWEEVLGVSRVGVTDNFFRIGGDSILSIQISTRIRQLGFHCNVQDIFEYNNVSRLASYLDHHVADKTLEGEQGLLRGTFGLLPIQARFIEEANSGFYPVPQHMNQSFMIRVPSLDTDRLSKVLSSLVAYHDMFRVHYFRVGGELAMHQEYQPEISVPALKILDVREYSESELHRELTLWQSAFDLESGPLFQVGYLYGYEDGNARVYFALHHLLVDGVSWRILSEDLKTLYDGGTLPAKGSSYREWVSAVSAYPDSHAEESDYWAGALSGVSNYSRETMISSSSVESVEFEESSTKFLLQEASKAYQTEINDLLLTALAYALRDVDGELAHGITLEGHGREAIASSIDHSHTLGWFTSVFPVKLELGADLRESIQGIKESLRNIPNKGIGFGSFAVSDSTSYGFKDLVPISFNYLGQFGNDTTLDWQLVAEDTGAQSAGANINRNIINFNGAVINEKLSFSIASKLGEETTHQLCTGFKEHLEAIIAHCQESLSSSGASYTPSDFSTVEVSQSLLNNLGNNARVLGTQITYIYPATSLQQGFIYHALSQPDDDAYQGQFLFDYNDRLDVDKYLEAWRYCIARYPSLRTAFNWEEEPLQVVYKEGILNFELHNISDLPNQELRDMEIEKIRLLDRSRPFDLTRPSLFRLHIIKQSEECYTILRNVHHSISDGWSTPILLKNLQDYYLSLVSGEKISVEEDQAYLDTQEYIAKYKSSISSYWEECLSGVESANDINGLLSRPVNLNNYKRVARSCETSLELGGDFYKALKKFSLKEGITVNAIVQFVWHKLLQVYSGLEYSVVGTTVSGRSLPVSGITDSVGLYINTLPLVVNWTSGSTILEELHHIQHQVNDLNAHSYSDLAKLQRSGIRLFHSLFVFENYPIPKDAVKDVSKLKLREVKVKVNYPLSLRSCEYSDVLTLNLKYDGECLWEPKADSHMEDLRYLLEQVVYHSDQAHDKITLLRGSAYQEVVYDWNATDAAYDMGASLVSLFEAQVAESPDAVALVYEGEMLTYGELNAKSNQLARHLRRRYKESVGQDLSSDILIALCLDRSLEMIIGILGVLKAGGAYVPMDPGYPQNRIDFILGGTSSSLILTNSDVLNSSGLIFPQEKLINIRLDASFFTDEAEDSGNLGLSISSDSLAYVIYTSGTTGKPKGVMVEHGNVTNLITDLQVQYEIEPSERFILFASYVFDASVEQLFLSLLSGSSLYLVDRAVIGDAKKFTEFVASNGITHVHATPSYLVEVSPDQLPTLKRVIFGGEYLSKRLFESYSAHIPMVINQYGPTETTITSLVSINSYLLNNISISNTKVYVLDNSGHPVPVGVAGELYIGGAGVSRGYLNREALTSERFVLNRFASKSDRSKGYDRLYKTGDLVRWHSDGNLEYLGRNDDQVKIRGYRIELGEIESALSSIGGVSQSCVLSKERTTDSGESKYLVGYYVLEEGSEELTEEYLLEALSSLVPDYMIPSRLIVLEQFPLTVNGKLDRRSLPEVESLSGEDEYVAPQSETERSLCKIWEEVLGVSRVGVTDNFFRIGGDSILSIQISTRIRQLGFHCNVQDIFEYNNVSRLASYLDHHVADETLEGEQGLLRGTFGLLPIQARFIEEANSGFYPVPQHMNQSFMIRVPSLDTDRLSKVLSSLVAYHDMFRVHYFRVGGELAMHQEYQPEISVPALKILDVREYSESELHRELTLWQSAFDLESGPLFQVGYLYGYEDGNARVYFALHHLLVDGVSWRILSEDLKTLYDGGTLPAKGSSYREWVSAVSAYPDSHAEESDYWAGALSGVSNYSRETMISSSSVESVEFEESSTKFLLQEASKAYQTEINDLLLTALAYALRDVDGELAHGITLEGHGREAIASSIDHSHTLGWFTSVFPVKLELGADLRESIQGIKESLRNIPNKGIGFGSFAVSDSTSYGFKDLVPISFNYLGQFGNDTTLDWQLVAEDTGAQSAGANINRNIINFNGAVINEKLSFSIASKLGEETTHQLCTGFKEHLEAIIAHCQESLSSSGASYTPSDFSTVEVSQSLLDKLQNNLNTGNEE